MCPAVLLVIFINAANFWEEGSWLLDGLFLPSPFTCLCGLFTNRAFSSISVFPKLLLSSLPYSSFLLHDIFSELLFLDSKLEKI
jgi:hypothetical protein